MTSGHGSGLALQEYFDTGDDRFLETLRATQAPKRLASLAERWKRDPRPWARTMLFAYLEQPLDRPGHEPLVRRLFKHAEAQNDAEMMGAFLVAFDGLVRRRVAKRWRWGVNWQDSWTEEYLATPSNRIPNVGREPLRAWQIPAEGRLFSYASRHYLRRRAWRWFRRLGYQQSDTYVSALVPALARYRDEDLQEGQNMLDSWGLMQALFRHASVLTFGRSLIDLVEGASLGELASAPRFPALWAAESAGEPLLGLVTSARSRLVRVFAMDTLRAQHAGLFDRLGLDRLLPLFDAEDPEVQRFAAESLVGCSSLASLSIDAWLRLLDTRNPEALQAVCDAMAVHVSPERLDLEACVRLACAEPLPVARLALGFLETKAVRSAEDRAALARLGDARCAALGDEITRFALEAIAAPATYTNDEVMRFLDSTTSTVRTSAWAWVLESPQAYDDPVLWARLAETPYDDMRLRLVEALEGRLRPARLGQEGSAVVWASVLLAVHRGGRQKLKAVRQMCDEIAAEPARAPELLPVMTVAVRSIRAPEMRAGLSAVLTLLERRPELGDAVAEALPELELSAQESV